MTALYDVGTKQSAVIDDLQIHLPQQSALANAFNQAGLGEIARVVSGDTFMVCDLPTYGVEGCGAIRAAASRDQLVGEVVALGLALLVAVLVGAFAVTFVRLVTGLVSPLGKHRANEHLMLRGDRANSPQGSVAATIRKEKSHGI